MHLLIGCWHAQATGAAPVDAAGELLVGGHLLHCVVDGSVKGDWIDCEAVVVLSNHEGPIIELCLTHLSQMHLLRIPHLAITLSDCLLRQILLAMRIFLKSLPLLVALGS